MIRKYIIYFAALLFMFILPVVRYYVSTPWINWCVIDYVDWMDESWNEWYLYSIDWMRHVEPKNSNMVKSLEQYKIWNINWCIVSWDNYFSDLNNTFYCSVAYMIRKSPLSESMKTPLWIMKK